LYPFCICIFTPIKINTNTEVIALSNAIREVVCGYVENIKPKLENIVLSLHDKPELSGEEEESSSLIMNVLEEEGFKIDSPICKIPHSFMASYGTSGPAIGYICEYDALPDIGHGCGHNISTAINIGAAIGLKRAISEIGGRAVVIGCPAEECSPTKINMYTEGVFSGISAIICGHAWNDTHESGSSYGMKVMDFSFHGKSAHTSINPQEGNNPLYPCVLTIRLSDIVKNKYSNKVFINGRIHGSPDPVHLIPESYSCSLMVKGKDSSIVSEVMGKIMDCSRFSSELYNCVLESSSHIPEYKPLKTHNGLSRIACHNLKERGLIEINPPEVSLVSLDIGCVSQEIPTIHPYIGICKDKGKVPYYSREFSECTTKKYALNAMLKSACALALTGVDIIQKPEILG
jgi:amidohydrolase